MTKTKTQPWDAVDFLKTEEARMAYLEAALEEGDASLIATALGDLARAKGITHIAQQTGLGRESLYKALSPGGNPEFATVLRVLRVLGLRLHAKKVRVAIGRVDPKENPTGAGSLPKRRAVRGQPASARSR